MEETVAMLGCSWDETPCGWGVGDRGSGFGDLRNVRGVFSRFSAKIEARKLPSYDGCSSGMALGG